MGLPPARVVAIVLMVVCSAGLVRQADVYVDIGTCIGGPCSRDGWAVATREVPLRASPAGSAETIATLRAGDIVEIITGQVHASPRRLTVLRAHAEFEPGDRVDVYTYRGAGWYRIRHNGVLKDADLGISPWSDDPRCLTSRHCWGSLDEQIQLVEWVKVRGRGGVEGWVHGTSAFRDTDRREGVPDPGSLARRQPQRGRVPGAASVRLLRLLAERIRAIDAATVANVAREFPPDLALTPLVGLTRDRLRDALGPHFVECELPLDPTTGEPTYAGPCRSERDILYALHSHAWGESAEGTVLHLRFDHRDVCVAATWARRRWGRDGVLNNSSVNDGLSRRGPS